MKMIPDRCRHRSRNFNILRIYGLIVIIFTAGQVPDNLQVCADKTP
jgi:hypothetical protein